MDTFITDDPRVNRIGDGTWIDADSRYVFEIQGGGVNVFNLRKGPAQTPPLNLEPFDTLDAAVEQYLGPRET